ncbi:MAG TPA: SMP-30/gluconolactonase/LRE family protein [Microvirga sp.]|jgi:sugar lactone lactonase YvrE|nr:SMP-30/gluconolactonase/LRE family protein [Microvirga sp.]
MISVDVASPLPCILGEAPVWCAEEGALYWVDVRAPALHRLARSGAVESWPMPELCGALVRTGDGRLAVGLLSEIILFDPGSGARDTLVAVEPRSLGNRLNEAKCDAAGRLWVGSMRDFGAATTGSLYRVEAAAGAPTATRVLSGITIPNALAWSPDGRTMYFADTGDGRLRAYDFEAGEGRLGPMRVVLDAGAAPGKPDGLAVDAEGCLWNARYGAGCVVRTTPEGRVDQVVALPTAQPTSCAFGGPGLDTLFVTTASQRLTEAERAEQPLAGALFALKAGVRGAPVAPLSRGADRRPIDGARSADR